MALSNRAGKREHPSSGALLRPSSVALGRVEWVEAPRIPHASRDLDAFSSRSSRSYPLPHSLKPKPIALPALS